MILSTEWSYFDADGGMPPAFKKHGDRNLRMCQRLSGRVSGAWAAPIRAAKAMGHFGLIHLAPPGVSPVDPKIRS
jgi:hypothetical protein